jgi:hypothetical protein
MKFASRASKKMEYLVHDLESTGQPAVTEAAEAAPLWEQQLINICWLRLQNNSMQYGELPHCTVTRHKTTYCLIVVSPFISDAEKKGKCESVPLHAIKAYRGKSDIAPLIHNLGVRCRWEVKFTPPPLYDARVRTPVPTEQDAVLR